MKSRFISMIILMILSGSAYAQPKYMFADIPDTLLNANAVIRTFVTTIEIKNEGRYIYSRKYALTILNAAGEEHASETLHYDKLISVRQFDGNLYDAMGRKVRSIKKGEIKDYSGTGSDNLADDNRVKTHQFFHATYPYTVEYETSVEYDGIFYFPSWMPLPDEHISVEQSSFTVKMPADYKLRYKMFNYKNEPETSTDKDVKTITWNVSRLQPVKSDYYSVPWHEFTPSVFLAPTNFILQKYTGDMSNWSDFGKFLYILNEGRDKLPEATKVKVHQLTAGLSETDKIKALYKFMQQNTRYISIQLGIGGWQTFDAASVATNGYGDCKALTNYMYSLLKEAGIKSYYTLIRAGNNNQHFMADFPSNQFNHVILSVPQKNDTLWLECTSQSAVPGYLGRFTSNRNALLVDEKGGVLVKTPHYKKADNLQSRKIRSVLDAEGNLLINVETNYYAEQQDRLEGMLTAYSKETITEYLKEDISIASFDLLKFNYVQNKSATPSISENLEIKATNFATVTGKRLFITPNILNRSGIKLTGSDKRVTPVKITMAYTDTDTMEMDIPAGYIAESIPDPAVITSKFGKYSSSVSFSPGRITYTRFLECYSGTFPSSDAPELENFYNKIYKADRSRLVLVKKE